MSDSGLHCGLGGEKAMKVMTEEKQKQKSIINNFILIVF